MKSFLYILFSFWTLMVVAGGDYLITEDGEKIEVKRLQVRQNKFHVRLKDCTTKVYSTSEIDSYYDSENDAYFEKLEIKEKTQFCEVVLSDGLHKIVVFKEKMSYGGGQIYFEELYFFEGKKCKGLFTKKNHYQVLSHHFHTCARFQAYVNTKKRWFNRLNKLDAFLKTNCQ